MSLLELKDCFDRILSEFGRPNEKDELCDRLVEAVREWNSTAKFIIGADGEEAKPNDLADEQPDLCDGISLANPQVERLKEEDNQGDVRKYLSALSSGMSHRTLEKTCKPEKAVAIRRRHIEDVGRLSLKGIPHKNYDYEVVNGQCCENLVGYIPLPTGVVGPLNFNGELLHVLLSTTEGALVASANRGCKALAKNGVQTILIEDYGMTRAPVLEFKSVTDAHACSRWIQTNRPSIRTAFEGTSRFCKLQEIEAHIDGCNLHLRFRATTGDAMGMNMVTKATQAALEHLKQHFEKRFELLSLSGNMCTDKKAAAINWINGRGKKVVAEATVPADVVTSVLKSDVHSMVKLAAAKLSQGSSLAVSIGGQNAQAANVVAAMFIATGQDAAQVISSSMCSTAVRLTDNGDLYMSCTMNCVEVGTVGGGTILEPQKAALRMLGCAGPNLESPGANARRFAQIVCATVLAGELSLLASQCSGDLVRSHMILNRSSRLLDSIATCPAGLGEKSRTRDPTALPRELATIPCGDVFA